VRKNALYPICNEHFTIFSGMLRSRVQLTIPGQGQDGGILPNNGLKSLEEQRKIDDLVLVYKIYHQKLPLLFSDYFDCSQTTHNTRNATILL
jgi:hypothetical protein